MGRLTTRRRVRRTDTGPEPAASTEAVDVIAVEEPLELRLSGASLTVTMRTPGHDVELAHGLLFGEGVIDSARDVVTARYCPGAVRDLATGTTSSGNSYNVLDVRTADGVRPPTRGPRAFVTSSACGVCGTPGIADLLATGLPELRGDQTRFAVETIAGLPDRLRSRQPVFAATGGVHAAALCSADGTPLVVREDVGRHNAVDKVIGWALLNDALPGRGLALVVSGRASYELAHKAIRACVPLLSAVSAPSSLAIDLADAAGLTLVGFTRSGRFTTYSHPQRIAD